MSGVNNDPGSCWCIVAPPCLGGNYVAHKIKNHISSLNPTQNIALISPDEVREGRGFIQSIAYQWKIDNADLYNLQYPDNSLFDCLFSTMKSSSPPVLIINRFHKILEKVDESLLAKLRTIEDAGGIKTINISIYDYNWLRKRWKKVGKKLTTSDYGTTAHRIEEIELVNFKDFEQSVKEHYEGIYDNCLHTIYEWTSGFFEPINDVLHEWSDNKYPWSFENDVLKHLEKIVTRSFYRLVNCIDSPDETTFKEHLIHLFHNIDKNKSISDLDVHPWSSLLIDKDTYKLRTPLIGKAAVEAIIQDDLFLPKNDSISMECKRAKWAEDLYGNNNFSDVVNLYSTIDSNLLSTRERVLLANSKILSNVYNGERYAGIDTDWTNLLNDIRKAKKIIKSLDLSTDYQKKILSKYEMLEKAAFAVTSAKSSNVRIADSLAGLLGSDKEKDLEHALMLVQMSQYIGETEVLDTRAMNVGLSLPEQILRIWGFWLTDINYYECPEGHEEVWRMASEYWLKNNSGELKKPNSGGEFLGIKVYAYFLQAFCNLYNNVDKEYILASDFSDLQRQISIFDMRNPAAHTIMMANPKDRKRYFNVTRIWVDRLSSYVEKQGFSTQKYKLFIRPLPLPTGI